MSRRRWAGAWLCGAVLALGAAEPAVLDPWARASLPGAEAGAVYLRLVGGDADDRLVAARAELCAVTEVHEHVRDAEGVLRMRAVAGGIPVPARATVELKPGGYHIMLIGLQRPLRRGERIPLTLVFERAGERRIEAEVLAPWAMSADDRD